MELLNQLNWRYATKAMNGEKVSQIKRNSILEAMRLAPTSLGFQPFHFIVVTDEALKQKLAPAMNNQPQVLKSDSLIIIASYKQFDPEDVTKYLNNIIATRQVPAEAVEGFGQMIKGFVSKMDAQQFKEWTAKQAYIALGFGLVAAAAESVDSTPMEGFIHEQVDEILDLHQKNLTSTVILTLGYRDEALDYLNGKAKVRRAFDDLITEL